MMFGCLLSVGLLFGATELRSPDVPFVAKNVKRVAVVPAVEGGAVTFGDRRLVLECGQIQYSADGAQRFRLWHHFNRTVDGKAVYLRADEATAQTEATPEGVTVTTRLLEGQREIGRVAKTAHLTPDGALVIAVRHTCPKGYMPIYNLRLNSTQLLGQTLGYNGTAVTLPNDLPGYRKFRAPDCGSPFVRFDCATNCPSVGFTLTLAGVKAQFSRTDENNFDMRLFPTSDDAEIVLTFRPVACDRRADDCVLGGINFTAEDNLTVYSGSKGRNLVLDPSFESKMRLHSTRVGATSCRVENGELKDNDIAGIRDACVNGTMARTGRYSLQPARGDWLVLKKLPLVKGETYVFSCYVRSLDGKRARIGVTHRIEGTFPGLEFPTLKSVDWTKWTRIVSKPFKGGAALPSAEHFAVNGSANLLLDDVQIERGTEATPFASGELGFEMVTGSPEGTICDATRNLTPRVRVSGDGTLKGTLRLTGRDFFDRTLFEVKAPLRLGDDAEGFVALPETKTYPRGPVYVRIAFAPEGSDDFTYRDTVRLLNIDYAPSNAKWRHLFDSMTHPHYKYTHAQMNALGILNRWTAFWLPDPDEALKYIHDEHFIPRSLRTIDLRSGPDYKWYVGDLLFRDREGRDLNLSETYPDYFIKDVEDAVAKYVAARPWAKYWLYDTEPSGHHRSLQVGRYDEYAKLVIAVHRGVKRGNPKAMCVPLGHCSHSDEGLYVTVPTLKAAKKIAPDIHFEGCGAHSYCEHPEIPDLDKTIAGLLRNLTAIGYGDMKLTLDEGGYFAPQRVSAFRFAPWAGTVDKDTAGGEVKFSNDAGWAEHVSVAMAMRYYVMMFKYADRLLEARAWLYPGESEPYSWTAMINVFHRILGDSTFVENFEFAPAARVYFFKDGHGRFIAIPWLFSRELDYGREEGQRMYLPAAGLGVELVDLMGNRCTAPEKDGALDLPLNNYPYYICVPERNAEKLIDAFRRVEYTPKADSIPYGLATHPVSATDFTVDITNPFATEKRLTVRIGATAPEEIVLASGATKTLGAKFPTASADGVINDYVIPIAITCSGFTSRESLLMRTWNVKHVATGAVDWAKVPAVRLTGKMPKGWKGPDDFSAVCRLAWRDGELLVRTEAKDDAFVPSPAGRDDGWSWFFESTQLFFDGFGNGRANLRGGINGFDADDFVYDVFAVSPTEAKVYRNRVPDQQLTFGLHAPKAGSYAGMPCVFEAKDGRRTLTLTLTDYDLAPAKASMERPMAFAVMIHDIDDLKADCDHDRRVFGKANVDSVPQEDGGAFPNPQHYAWLILQP